LAPMLGDLIKGLGAWSQKCMECPQVGRQGVFRQNTSNWPRTCSSRITLHRSCMNEVKSALAKVLAEFVHLTGGQCKSVQLISSSPITLQVLINLA